MYVIDPLTDLALMNDDVVLRRTSAGQHEVIAPSRLLDGTTQRLLLVVNGFTPLRQLIDACFDDLDIRDALHDLRERRLIEPVPPQPSFQTTSQW